ncbi:threonine ammonia-lyase [Hellea balneolensis]|uniref:threonine ammonia-lyase n=1 Tax=Hellea balneolensis TaxID=287478 RepID=UPI00040FA7B7|nr:threonine/serine dehydratase [Hellea balneolensis]
MTALPNFQDVQMAAERIEGHAYKTELLRSDVIDVMTGKSVWFKPECLQKVGAFKYRGAFNRLSAMSKKEREKGVVATSSGNHAQGVSRAAKELGIDAVIIMPTDAPDVKTAGVLNDGATIISYDRLTESREEIAREISKQEGRIIVPSYDDPYIISGQGTVGLEIARSGISFDALITCMGGGGLCAGISLSLGELSPRTKIYGAEPQYYNDHQMSFNTGSRETLSDMPPTLCDALMTPQPGALTWPINRQSLSGVFAISDMDCLMSMAIAKKELNVQLEPGGAVAMAALLTGALSEMKDLSTICIILSGGNVDPNIAQRADKLLD